MGICHMCGVQAYGNFNLTQSSQYWVKVQRFRDILSLHQHLFDWDVGDRGGTCNVGLNSTLTRLMARERFSKYILRESFISCKTYHIQLLSYKSKPRICILWRIDPLLGNDRETNNETTALARKSTARQWTRWVAITWGPQQARTQQWYSNRRTVFSMLFLPRLSKQGTSLERVNLWREDFAGAVESCEHRSWRISVVESRYQETSGGECNRLRTLVLWEWFMKCSHELCNSPINPISKPNPVYCHPYTWQYE
jgi:hypothetical protein